MSEATWIQDAVHQHSARLVGYVTRLVGDPELAQDVVQDGFVRLCAQPRAVVEAHLVPWLFTVCRNLAVDRLRQRQQHREVAMDITAHEVVADAAPPSQRLESSEDHAGILALLATLPRRQQEVVRLRFQEGLSYQDIAQVMQVTTSNVGFLIHTAIRALQARAHV
jgi:RNA polymerase sigma-70 factor (ECF subfamily)